MAPRKKVAVAAEQPTPKKRAYRRKAAPVQAAEAISGVEVNGEQTASESSELQQVVDQEWGLTDIEILDLKGMHLAPRVLLLDRLANAGYIWGATLKSPLVHLSDLTHDYIGLNHNNKMLALVTEEQVRHSTAVAGVSIEAHVSFDWSRPRAVLPLSVEINGVVYARQA